jgi:hypothetical protein
MNIFYLDKDIKKCAEYHVNKHVSKMIIETAQLLSSAYYFTEDKTNITPIIDTDIGIASFIGKQKLIINNTQSIIYNLTHKGHPCAVWTRESLSNWLWLKELGLALYQEYKYRYNNKIHKSGEIIEQLITPSLIDIGFTPIKQCMPLQYQNIDPVQAYRDYYKHDKQHILQYRNRDIPEWLK